MAQTRFLVMSDTHDLDISSLHTKLPEADVLLHCGDVTEYGSSCSFDRFIESLASFKSIELKLVIAGNHDISLDRVYWLSQDGTNESEHLAALSKWKSDFCVMNNIHFLEEGIHQFELKSGIQFKVYASPYTPMDLIESAFQYSTSEDRYNSYDHHSSDVRGWAKSIASETSLVPDFPGVDIIMTHGPPKHIFDLTSRNDSAGCFHLRRALERARPRLHCFGHVHAGWGSKEIAWRSHLSQLELEDLDWRQENDDEAIELPLSFRQSSRSFVRASDDTSLGFGKQTLFVNAAIENDNGKPGRRPWLIDLSLPMKIGR